MEPKERKMQTEKRGEERWDVGTERKEKRETQERKERDRRDEG
jgi:hypothetical protein